MPVPEGFKRPHVKLVGTDGNVFALLARCSKALETKGHRDLAKEMRARCFSSHSYDEALGIMMEYVDAH